MIFKSNQKQFQKNGAAMKYEKMAEIKFMYKKQLEKAENEEQARFIA